jgi:hypothetical protein
MERSPSPRREGATAPIPKRMHGPPQEIIRRHVEGPTTGSGRRSPPSSTSGPTAINGASNLARASSTGACPTPCSPSSAWTTVSWPPTPCGATPRGCCTRSPSTSSTSCVRCRNLFECLESEEDSDTNEPAEEMNGGGRGYPLSRAQ